MRKRTLRAVLASHCGPCSWRAVGTRPPTAAAPALSPRPPAERPRQTALLPDQQSEAPLLPDAQMTPGDTLDVTVQDMCVPGYTQKVRNVPAGSQAAGVRRVRHRQPPARRVRGGPSHQPGTRRLQLRQEPVAPVLPDAALERARQGRPGKQTARDGLLRPDRPCRRPSTTSPPTGSPPTRSISTPTSRFPGTAARRTSATRITGDSAGSRSH